MRCVIASLRHSGVGVLPRAHMHMCLLRHDLAGAIGILDPHVVVVYPG